MTACMTTLLIGGNPYPHPQQLITTMMKEKTPTVSLKLTPLGYFEDYTNGKNGILFKNHLNQTLTVSIKGGYVYSMLLWWLTY